MQGSYVLPQDEHKLVYGIRWEYSLALPGELVWSWATTGFPDELLTATFTMSNNGVTVAKDIPVTDSSTLIEFDGVVSLPQPVVWKGQTILKTTLNLPQAGVGFVRASYLYFGLIS